MSDGFLSRWARRKQAVRQSEADPAPVEADARPEAEAVEAGTPATGAEPEAIADLLADLPSLSDLTAETDLLPFLRAGVPAALRNAALRKMWSVDPAIRDFVSEAREYAYDWNTPGSVPGLGPLLPGDDVKAMLGRLFNRDPEAALPADEAPPPAEGPDLEPGTDSTPAPAPQARLDPPGPGPRGETSGDPEPTAAPAIRPIETVRLRRHGGAMPS